MSRLLERCDLPALLRQAAVRLEVDDDTVQVIFEDLSLTDVYIGLLMPKGVALKKSIAVDA